jgi:hypothetical protein
MTHRIHLAALAAALSLAPAHPAPAAASRPDGKAIIHQADQARGDREGVTWDVSIDENSNGEVQSAGYQVLGKGFLSLVNFISPAQSKGRRLLMLDRNMWFVRPGLSRPVPISPRQRLLGNAANGDLASTNYADSYDIVSMQSEPLDGKDTYVFELKANNSNTTYDRIKYWISRDEKVGVQAHFLTSTGRLLKTAIFEYGNEVTVRGARRKFISRMIIHDPQNSASVTTLAFRDVRLAPLPDSTFNLNLILR